MSEFSIQFKGSYDETNPILQSATPEVVTMIKAQVDNIIKFIEQGNRVSSFKVMTTCPLTGNKYHVTYTP